MKKIFPILVLGLSEVFGFNTEVSCSWVLENLRIESKSIPTLVLSNFEKNKNKYSCFETQKMFNYKKIRRFIATSPDSSTSIGLTFENEKQKATIACYLDKRKLTVNHIVHSGSEKMLGDEFIVIYKEGLVGKTFLNSISFSYYIYPPQKKIPVMVCERYKSGNELTSFVYIGKIQSSKLEIAAELIQLDGEY